MILKFVVDFIDGQAVFLDGKETSVLMSFCLRLLQIYSSHNIGKVRTESFTALFCVRIFSPNDATNGSCSETHTFACLTKWFVFTCLLHTFFHVCLVHEVLAHCRV